MMRRIHSRIDPRDAAFLANVEHNRALAAELERRQHAVRTIRPERDLQRLERQGKMTVRARLEQLLDPGTPFLELSTLAAGETPYAEDAPGAGQLVGIGIVSGKEVVIRADDSSVKGGAWYPMSVKKIVRALDIAIENRLPVVHMCDSAGGFLPLQAQFFADRYGAGRIFRNQSTLSKMGVPQVALVLGNCTAGGAYIPALSDYSVIVRGTGAIFLGGPPLVKAATGEDVTVDELGGADMHTSVSGVADYPADNELHGIAITREIVAQWRRQPKAGEPAIDPEPPAYDPAELYGILPADGRVQFDMREVIARIVDGSRFHEYQPGYGTTLICGYARIWGQQVGILANNGVLFSDSALKGAHFIELCDQNRTPLLFLQNITGFMVGSKYEAGGIAKDGAKLVTAVASARVPKFTVIIGGSFGAGNYGMCGRAYSPRFLWTWPNARISVMGGEQAAAVLAQVRRDNMDAQGKEWPAADEENFKAPIRAQYEEQGHPYYATARLWDDGIIDPCDTRRVLALALEATLSAPIERTPFGVFRM